MTDVAPKLALPYRLPRNGAAPQRKPPSMISVQHLSKRFGSQAAVDDLSFEIPGGQIVGFLGPNGAGKTTTLKMLTGMLEPTSGGAKICGFDLLRDLIEAK